MNSAFEVSISWKDSCGNEIVVFNDLIEDWINEISRVTNASHASITSKGETKSVKILSNSCFIVVTSDNLKGNNLLETEE